MKAGLDLEDIEAIARKVVEILTPLVQHRAGDVGEREVVEIERLGRLVWITPEEAVKYLRLKNQNALNHLVSKGIIPCVKAGGRKFHRPTLDKKLLDAQQ